MSEWISQNLGLALGIGCGFFPAVLALGLGLEAWKAWRLRKYPERLNETEYAELNEGRMKP